MAVKSAVVGYEEITKFPVVESDAEAEAEAEEEIADKELDDLERKDLEALLLMDSGDEVEGTEEGGICECFVKTTLIGSVYRIDEYIPDALYDSWESVRDFAIDWMVRVGILDRGAKGASKPSNGEGPRKYRTLRLQKYKA